MSAPERYVDHVFLTADGSPRLARCALLFLDLLGVTEMATSSLAQQNLFELEQAIRGLVRDFLDPESLWPAAMFSDTLVMASPVTELGGDEVAIAELLLQASSLQLSLAERGFFARGAITLGDFYIRDELVFGAALVEAYHLERDKAIHPRVIRWISEYHNHFCNERKDEDWFTPDLLIPGADLAQELHPII